MKAYIILIVSILITLTGIISSCQSEADINFKRYYSAGQLVYQGHCQNCHGDNGQGLNALIPPLTDTAFIGRSHKLLPCIIKNGLGGGIMINDKLFNQQMPAQTDLSPIEIAQVVTYIGNSYGSKIGLVEVQDVEKDLAACVVELKPF